MDNSPKPNIPIMEGKVHAQERAWNRRDQRKAAALVRRKKVKRKNRKGKK